MTPLPPTNQRLMEDLALIFGESINEYKLIDGGLKQLRSLKPGETLSDEDKQAFFRLCVESRRHMSPMERESALAKIAVACAALGDKPEMTKPIDLIEDRTDRFYALLNCAMSFPPVTATVYQGNIYRKWIELDGFGAGMGGGVF